MLPEPLADQIERTRHCLFYVATQFSSDLKVMAHHAQQPKLFEVDTGRFRRKESLGEAWLMSAQPQSRKVLSELRLFEGKDFPRLASAGKRIEQDHYLASVEIIDEVEGGGAEIEQLNLRADLEL